MTPLTVIFEIAVGKSPLRVTVVGPEATQAAGVTESTLEVCAGGVTGTTAAQLLFTTVFVSNVTAPVNAMRDPSTLAEVVPVIEVCAMMCPTNEDEVPRVAEEPTSQKTLHACAPPVSVMTLELAVVRLDAVSKIKTELGSPAPLRVRVPVSPASTGTEYAPAPRTRPPRAAPIGVVG